MEGLQGGRWLAPSWTGEARTAVGFVKPPCSWVGSAGLQQASSLLPPAGQPAASALTLQVRTGLSVLGHQLLEGRTGQTRGMERVEGREVTGVGWVARPG